MMDNLQDIILPGFHHMTPLPSTEYWQTCIYTLPVDLSMKPNSNPSNTLSPKTEAYLQIIT